MGLDNLELEVGVVEVGVGVPDKKEEVLTMKEEVLLLVEEVGELEEEEVGLVLGAREEAWLALHDVLLKVGVELCVTEQLAANLMSWRWVVQDKRMVFELQTGVVCEPSFEVLFEPSSEVVFDQ